MYQKIFFMGRREQKERERKRAASSFESLERYLLPKKKKSDGAQAATRCEYTACGTSLASATVGNAAACTRHE